MRIFNPIIYLWNLFKYMSHLENHRNSDYEPYDFENNDTKYY